MRMLMKVSIPVEPGNRGLREGSLPDTIMKFVDQMKPEACYFCADGGKRSGFFVFDLKDSTMIPAAAEPFFLNLNASVEMSPVMNLDDLKTGIEKAMRNA